MTSVKVNGNIRRILVALKLNDNSEVICSKFTDCIVNQFITNDVAVDVECKLSDNTLLLSPLQKINWTQRLTHITYNSTNLGCVTLQHSPECPIMRLPEEDKKSLLAKNINQGVAVCVSIILESADSRLLMTQRAGHMRSFPNVWVPPGGHMEDEESMLECGFRELKEETGLILNDTNSETCLLCLWESVYPVMLGFGSPKNHQIVLYLLTKVKKNWEQLQEEIELDEDEVQACTWLTPNIVEALIDCKTDGVTHTKFVLGEDGKTSPEKLDISRMFHTALWAEGKIYSGAQLALTKWLESYKERVSKCSL